MSFELPIVNMSRSMTEIRRMAYRPSMGGMKLAVGRGVLQVTDGDIVYEVTHVKGREPEFQRFTVQDMRLVPDGSGLRGQAQVWGQVAHLGTDGNWLAGHAGYYLSPGHFN